ncbi:MAG TPA: hypothetical protein VM841_08295 [Actinomycetota bacterium]|nr:hypothetical protein [Actinomycetota bacterium]
MRFTVEPWSPEYAAPFDSDAAPEPGAPPAAEVDERVEAEPAEWTPKPPPHGAVPAKRVMFVDGVQRIDAWVWVAAEDGTVRPGICASYAAGVVCCDGRADVPDIEVRRGLFSAAPVEPINARRVVYRPYGATGESVDQLRHAVQQRMGELEADLARRCGPADLIVLDGPLRGRQNVPDAIGFVKSHQQRYLSDPAHAVVGRLGAGERTPLFLMTTSWTRYSWYLRLPGPAAQPWSSVVRCEASADLSAAEATRVADRAAATLPMFASAAHKDPRAPQNLYPIGGLERALRHRLGDPALLYRELRQAASRPRSAAAAPAG